MSKYVGSVSSANEYTTKVGADILRQGGNAWDAIVAAGFASAVSEFGFTSVGGGGFMLSLPVNGEPVSFFLIFEDYLKINIFWGNLKGSL